MPETRADNPTPSSETPSLELRRLRRQVDAIDRRIVALMNRRARLGLQIGAVKSAAGRRSVLDAEREREVLSRVAAANHGPLPDDDLLAIYRRLVSATRRLESAARSALEPGDGSPSAPAAGPELAHEAGHAAHVAPLRTERIDESGRDDHPVGDARQPVNVGPARHAEADGDGHGADGAHGPDERPDLGR